MLEVSDNETSRLARVGAPGRVRGFGVRYHRAEGLGVALMMAPTGVCDHAQRFDTER